MNHSLIAEAFGIRHRPVKMEDAEFFVWLRNLEHAKGKISDSSRDVTDQEEWLRAYFQREGDYYFVTETTSGIPVGAFGIYAIADRTAEIGRWVVRPDVPAALPSALLAFDLAFGQLGLSQLSAKAVATNQRALKLYLKFGFHQTCIESGAQSIGGHAVDLIHLLMPADEWNNARPLFLKMAHMVEVQIRKWERDSLRNSKTPAVSQ